jgi:hypothetical protein
MVSLKIYRCCESIKGNAGLSMNILQKPSLLRKTGKLFLKFLKLTANLEPCF